MTSEPRNTGSKLTARAFRTVGWGSSQEPSFGGMQDQTSIKAKIINLINSVRTLMRSKGTSASEREFA